MAKKRDAPYTIGARETRDLPVKLAETEIDGLGRDLAVHLEEIEQIEKDKAGVVAEYNNRLKRKKSDMEKVSREVRTKERIVPVQTEWRYYWEQNRKILVRLDTGDELDSLGIQDFERQKQFPGVKVVSKPDAPPEEPETDPEKDPPAPDGKTKAGGDDG